MYPIIPISPYTVQELSLRPCRINFFSPLQAGHHGGFILLPGILALT